ncbi:helix-turn-helix domain-containing protein [Actinobacteria bacterium YIM 96077]|uniref:AraC family transcriptional regulator n=1 Tax=Phytoactinopolyspora halophila TaxID=1981511 RepID=A0A329R5R4_9ACTN|nr:helix-turn-helix domain-containing protein [Phytoactinopolyspora halophila]AYY11993.1 helix-turn-helix domain-containing protein [Actinobacteria bacterium YIM 96077]RAW18772.1 AraC family transcriptional regulator [Phytoactinopolyspora halophila]
MLRKVVALAFDDVAPFELGVLCEAFGIDRSEDGLPVLDFRVCALRPGKVTTTMGFDLVVEHGLEALEDADLIGIPAVPRRLTQVHAGVHADGEMSSGGADAEELMVALRAAVERGARVLSVCTGAFVLAKAGLLDGKRCTTHWKHAETLANRYPQAKVDPDVLYVDEDPIITSAGTAAGIDACLHLWRKEFGAQAAATVARRMVVPPHRDGGQAQFVEAPLRPTQAHTLAGVLDYMESHLHQEMTIDGLAALASMSPRTFARRFRAETGTTPYDWLVTRRVAAAQRMLEHGQDTIDAVAAATGFGTAAALRHHFTRRLGTTPQAYRATFCEYRS